MKAISHLYDNYEDAQAAVRALDRAGVASKDISVVASNADNWYSGDNSTIVDRDGDGVDDTTEAVGAGATVGAGVGGAAGLLAGLGIMAIPGLGPVVAAGWLAATAAGAIAGGATGGLIGGLTQMGVGDEEANVYAEGIRRGGTLVTVKVADADESRIQAVLDRSRPVDIASRGAAYRSSGWTKFDPNSAPFTSEQVKAERGRY